MNGFHINPLTAGKFEEFLRVPLWGVPIIASLKTEISILAS